MTMQTSIAVMLSFWRAHPHLRERYYRGQPAPLEMQPKEILDALTAYKARLVAEGVITQALADRTGITK